MRNSFPVMSASCQQVQGNNRKKSAKKRHKRSAEPVSMVMTVSEDDEDETRRACQQIEQLSDPSADSDSNIDINMANQAFKPHFDLYHKYEKSRQTKASCTQQISNARKNTKIHIETGSDGKQSSQKYTYVYDCTICNKKFRNRAPLNLHILSEHGGTSNTMCTDCGKQLDFEHQIDLHKRFVCQRSKRKYACSACKLRFLTAYDRESHPCTGDASKPYFCSEENCQFRSKSLSELMEHVTRHLGIKPFLCTTCGRSFSAKKDLDRHTDIHKETRGHVCEVCSKSFKSSNAVMKHKLLHKFKDRYKCKYCPYATALQDSFKQHMLKHTNKAHACKLCNKSLRSASSLATHVKNRHTFNRIFSCRFCDFSTSVGASFSNHMRKHKKSTEEVGGNVDAGLIPADFTDVGEVPQHTPSLDIGVPNVQQTVTPPRRPPMLGDASISVSEPDVVHISGQNADSLMATIVSASDAADITVIPPDMAVATSLSIYPSDLGSSGDTSISCSGSSTLPSLIMGDAITTITGTENWSDQS